MARTFIVAFRANGDQGTIASVSGLEGKNALLFNSDSVGFSNETAHGLSVNSQGVAAFPLEGQSVIIVAGSGDPVQSLKLGVRGPRFSAEHCRTQRDIQHAG